MEHISKKNVEDLNSDIQDTIKSIDTPVLKSRHGELLTKSLEEEFWKDPNKAKVIMQEMDHISDELKEIEELKENAGALLELFAGASEHDQHELEQYYYNLRKKYQTFQNFQFLSGKYDQGDALLSIHAGQGGTEANDWAQMLLRMYKRYFEKKGWSVETDHFSPGSETGVNTVSLHISGKYAFGLLNKESGVHRLVRLSPFNAQNLRQTSFAGVEVVPVIVDDEELSIPESDIEFKAVRSGGPGGQSVNKTSSAVQITHLPTGITVHSSERRSQLQNREAAMKILKSRLWILEQEKRDKEMKDIKGEHKVAGWGNQIRNYVLHPYKLVKDLRTKIERSDPENVLDGDLEDFIEAEIRLK